MSDAAKQLRELLARPGLVRGLAVHDAISGLVAQSEGVELLFLGGFGVAASQFGWPDVGLVTASEMTEAVRRMCRATSVPLIADADTGYGNEWNVQRTVRDYISAGAAGLLIEDQTFPKRCGHFAGKQVAPLEEMERRLGAAIEARNGRDFVIVARTDSLAVAGMDEALRRTERFMALGADVCFIEAPQSREQLGRVAREAAGPQLANMLTGGVTPLVPASELERMGFKLAVLPIESQLIAAAAVRKLARVWLEQGSVASLELEMLSFDEMKQLLRLDDVLRAARRDD